jgi:uncharacterized cupredoxin-like copper-binding protein
MTAVRRPLLVGALVAAVIALVASVAVAVGTLGGPAGSGGFRNRATSCTAPLSLPGSVVTVTQSDMGSMMAGPMMGSGTMVLGQAMPGMLGLQASATTVPAGTVSFVVDNVGGMTHEFVVLPLTGPGVGERSVGSDGKVSEAGSLGEASRSCGSGPGDGIQAGTVGWVTLHLPAGRYELICNQPWHYASGMYAELEVT